MGERLFSDAEMAEMGRRTIDRLNEALDAGDAPRAKEIARRMHSEFLAMHDLYRDKAAALQSFIGRRFGDDVLEEALTDSARSWWLPILARMPKGKEGLRQRIKMYVAGLRGHLQPLHIEEDDECVRVQMRPCGSGGRLILEGKYEGPDALYVIRNPHRTTYGRPNFPVYCAHEAPMERLDIEQHGSPMMVVEPARVLGREPCTFTLYKDPAFVPDAAFERLGLTRTAAGASDDDDAAGAAQHG
jgi:hypothetical protein